ncbi:3-hydroxyacyl-CoA dehydrogenase [Massilia sp. PWRC2]|uniref:3-hydroxyacyl-CoA dehydrogenase n=1 Tax=Massilia sp. PWRC2 TaxID=2804626 RepID=UPI003CEF7EF0
MTDTIHAGLPAQSLVAVIGAGAMGAGIAQTAASAGHPVLLFDTREGAAARAIADIVKVYAKLVDKGRMTAAAAAAAGARLGVAASLADGAACALVVEAIVENLAVKRTLFADLEALVGDDCILATNTSSISVTAIGATLRRPERLVGMHFFNPVPLMALVEVISGLATGPAVADTVYATALAWGKSPVHAKSTPGFIVNRVARPFYAEALRLLSEQAVDAATIDAIMREAGGFRMGPFELMDLIGHDVNFSVTQSVHQAYFGDPRFTPSVLQQEMVNAGFLGRKSGRGFYRYGDGASVPAAHTEAPQPRPTTVSVSSEAGVVHVVVAQMEARLRAADFQVEHRKPLPGAAAHEAPAFHCHGAAVFLTDGRTATERASANHHPDTVLFDLALDYAKAGRICLARADQCSDAAYDAVVGLMQAAGFAVSRIDDVAGMVVMRIVAMLANEAADAVNTGVCSAAAVDIAMQKGVNYPRGPLAWTDAIGVAQVVTVLANLAASYGEDRYRVAPLLRRKLAAASGAAGRFHD